MDEEEDWEESYGGAGGEGIAVVRNFKCSSLTLRDLTLTRSSSEASICVRITLDKVSQTLKIWLVGLIDKF